MKKISGVYKITNIKNGKIYIGSSNNIKKRWKDHRYRLNHNKHENSYLQNAWNKYGADSFIFEIIEEVEGRDNLFEAEQRYIDLYNVCDDRYGYNLSKLAVCGKLTPMTWEDVDENNHYMRSCQLKEIIRLLCETDLNFTEIAHRVNVLPISVADVFYRRTFANLTKDCKFVSPRFVDNAINKGKLTQDEIIEIVQLLCNTDMPINDIADKYNVSRSSISEIYNRKSWIRFTKDKIFIKRSAKKPILQFDLDGNFIAEYESILDATNKTGFVRSCITKCCNGKQKTYKGYLWSYKEKEIKYKEVV